MPAASLGRSREGVQQHEQGGVSWQAPGHRNYRIEIVEVRGRVHGGLSHGGLRVSPGLKRAQFVRKGYHARLLVAETHGGGASEGGGLRGKGPTRHTTGVASSLWISMCTQELQPLG